MKFYKINNNSRFCTLNIKVKVSLKIPLKKYSLFACFVHTTMQPFPVVRGLKHVANILNKFLLEGNLFAKTFLVKPIFFSFPFFVADVYYSESEDDNDDTSSHQELSEHSEGKGNHYFTSLISIFSVKYKQNR